MASGAPGKPLIGSTNIKRSNLSSIERGGQVNGIKANGSILSFFKKADSKPEESEDGLFLQDEHSFGDEPGLRKSLTPEDAFGGREWGRLPTGELEDLNSDRASRFHEDGQAVKRRKVATQEDVMPSDQNSKEIIEITNKVNEPYDRTIESRLGDPRVQDSTPSLETTIESKRHIENEQINSRIPELKHESTSYADDDFERLGELDEDLYAEGEEFQERRWMEEQRRFELAENGLFEDGFEDLPEEMEDYNAELKQEDISHDPSTSIESCPICSSSLAGISHDVRRTTY